MTVGQLAGLIAALALVVLVIFIAWFLVKVAGAIRDAITSVEQLTKDVDTLSGELNGILKNSNSLWRTSTKRRFKSIQPFRRLLTWDRAFQTSTKPPVHWWKT